MFKRIRKILMDTGGASFPLTIAIVLTLIIFLCGISEYFRLQVIASGVREAVEDAIISTVNDNYAGVYHGVREGYSGGYMPVSYTHLDVYKRQVYDGAVETNDLEALYTTFNTEWPEGYTGHSLSMSDVLERCV